MKCIGSGAGLLQVSPDPAEIEELRRRRSRGGVGPAEILHRRQQTHPTSQPGATGSGSAAATTEGNSGASAQTIQGQIALEGGGAQRAPANVLHQCRREGGALLEQVAEHHRGGECQAALRQRVGEQPGVERRGDGGDPPGVRDPLEIGAGGRAGGFAQGVGEGVLGGELQRGAWPLRFAQGDHGWGPQRDKGCSAPQSASQRAG